MMQVGLEEPEPEPQTLLSQINEATTLNRTQVKQAVTTTNAQFACSSCQAVHPVSHRGLGLDVEGVLPPTPMP